MAKAVRKSEKVQAVVNDGLVYEHIAEYVVQSFIKEDVNAFPESTLMQELIAFKLNEMALPMMAGTIARTAAELKSKKRLDLKKRVGGITQAKRIAFRTDDQYSAFVSLFFQAIENRPGLVDFIDGEQDFENFMLYCIYELREALDRFVEEIVRERLDLERQHKAYINRSTKAQVLDELPTYADFIADRIDGLIS